MGTSASRASRPETSGQYRLRNAKLNIAR